MPKRINSFKVFEASLSDDTNVGSGYLDDVKRRGEQESSDKMRQGYNPAQIPSLIPRLMEIQGARLDLRTKDISWINEERKLELEELVERIIRNEFSAVINTLDVELDLKLVGDKKEMEDAASEMESEAQDLPEEEEQEEEEETQEEEQEEQTDEEEEEQEEPNETLLSEVEKRKLINNITQGSAKNTHELIALYKDDIDNIDIRLYDIMERLIKSQETAEWDPNNPLNNMSDRQKGDIIKDNMNGFADIDFGDDEVDDGRDYDPSAGAMDDMSDEDESGSSDEEEKTQAEEYADRKPKLIARAYDIVVLLHESVKAIYEMIASSGIVEDEEMAQAIMNFTDTVSDEFEDLKYGVYIRKDLIAFVSQSDKIDNIENGFEYVWMKMVDIPAKQFNKLFKYILIDTYHDDTLQVDVYHSYDETDVTISGTPKEIIDGILDLIEEENNIHQEKLAQWEEQNREVQEWENDKDRYEEWKEKSEDEKGELEGDKEDDEIEKLIKQSQERNQPSEKTDDISSMSKKQAQDEIDRIFDEENISDPAVQSRLDKLTKLV